METRNSFIQIYILIFDLDKYNFDGQVGRSSYGLSVPAREL